MRRGLLDHGLRSTAVGAGSVVRGPVPAGAVVAGNPARALGAEGRGG